MANFKVAQVKALACQSLDRSQVCEILWNFEAKQALLYTAGTTLISPSNLHKLEAAQMKVAKWILAVSRSTRAQLTRLLLHRNSIQAEIEICQLSLWAQIMCMANTRCSKIALEAMRAQGHGQAYAWHEHIGHLQTRYGLLVGLLVHPDPPHAVRVTVLHHHHTETL